MRKGAVLGTAAALSGALGATAPARAGQITEFDLASGARPEGAAVIGCAPWSILTLTHAGVGLVVPVARPEVRAGYAIEVKTGLRCYRNTTGRAETPGLQLFPELGYSYTPALAGTTHLARLGLGIGYGNIWAAVTYAPRLVVGSRVGSSRAALGLRHGMILHVLLDLIELEMSHQVLAINDTIEQDVRGTFSINCGVVLLALYALRR